MTIHNETAYAAGRQRAINRNASTRRRNEFLNTVPDGPRLLDWLNSSGEFAARIVARDPADQAALEAFVETPDGLTVYEAFDVVTVFHPACDAMFSGDFGRFLMELADKAHQYGALTPRQAEVVRNALARAEERVLKAEQRKAERAAADAGSVHIGEIKKRQRFEFTVEKVLSYEGTFGLTFIHLCKDDAGNVIVYKGSKRLPEGPFAGKATVKAHEVRDGVAQTLISRPASD